MVLENTLKVKNKELSIDITNGNTNTLKYLLKDTYEWKEKKRKKYKKSKLNTETRRVWKNWNARLRAWKRKIENTLYKYKKKLKGIFL